MDNQGYQVDIEVKYRDTDSMGHVSSPVYYDYLQHAYLGYMFDMLALDKSQKLPHIMVKTSCEYTQPAMYGDVLTVTSRVVKFGTKSFEMEHIMRRNDAAGSIVAKGASTHVMFDYAVNRTAPVPEEFKEVRKALAKVRADKSVRVLVLGAAGRAFCTGHDMSDTAAPPTRAPDDDAGIALACDIVIAARSATFIQSFCKLGLLPDTGGTHFLPRLVGPARAAGLTLLGDKLGAEQAERWGLIWKCVDDAALQEEVDLLATRFAGAATLGLARTKQALQASQANTLEAQLALECDFMRELGMSADYHEGIAAFAEKRPPRFSGQAGPRPRRARAAAPAAAAAPAPKKKADGVRAARKTAVLDAA